LSKTIRGLKSDHITNKPIENVDIKDMVWDGNEWVTHEGVVFSGDKEVITWDGVTATEEHVVYVSDTESMTLKEAKERGIALWKGDLPFIK